jgi:hypothetical protein
LIDRFIALPFADGQMNHRGVRLFRAYNNYGFTRGYPILHLKGVRNHKRLLVFRPQRHIAAGYPIFTVYLVILVNLSGEILSELFGFA